MGHAERRAREFNERRQKLQEQELQNQMRAAAMIGAAEPRQGKYFSLWPVSIQYPGQPARIISWRVVTEQRVTTLPQLQSVLDQIAAGVQRKDGAPEPPEVAALFPFSEFVPQRVLDAETTAIEKEKLEAGEVVGPPTADLQPIDPSSPDASSPISSTSPVLDPETIKVGGIDVTPEQLLRLATGQFEGDVKASCVGCDDEITLYQAQETRGLCYSCAAKVAESGPALVTE